MEYRSMPIFADRTCSWCAPELALPLELLRLRWLCSETEGDIAAARSHPKAPIPPEGESGVWRDEGVARVGPVCEGWDEGGSVAGEALRRFAQPPIRAALSAMRSVRNMLGISDVRGGRGGSGWGRRERLRELELLGREEDEPVPEKLSDRLLRSESSENEPRRLAAGVATVIGAKLFATERGILTAVESGPSTSESRTTREASMVQLATLLRRLVSAPPSAGVGPAASSFPLLSRLTASAPIHRRTPLLRPPTSSQAVSI